MTPAPLFSNTGEPFPVTVLDDRAGVARGAGFVAAPPGLVVPQLAPAVFARVEALALAGKASLEAGDHAKAFEGFVAALDVLPDPREQWNAAGWLLVALGENALRARNPKAALGPLSDAMHCPGTIGNPFVHLRLGEVRLLLGDEQRAADELARAYMGGGRALFEGVDARCFALVERVLKPPPGMKRLP